MQALFQLSYSPWKFEIYRKIEACPLTVLRWLQPEINRAAAGDKLARQKVATIQFVAVSRHEVDLVLEVITPLVARGRAPGTCEVHTDHGTLVPWSCPFALHAENAVGNLEGEVVARVLHDRSQHRNAELRCACEDRGLSDPSLSVARQHEHMFACRRDGKISPRIGPVLRPRGFP